MRHGQGFEELYRAFTDKAKRGGLRDFSSTLRGVNFSMMFEYKKNDLLMSFDTGSEDDIAHESLLWLETLSRLANQMHLAGLDTRFEDSELPAGYTYVAQLAIHDLVDTAITAYRYGGPFPDAVAMETADFDLGTIYGAGPTRNPSLFRPTLETKFRGRFRLGKLNKVPGDTSYDPGPESDIPRIRMGPECGGEIGDKRFDPILADLRNADNLILSQIVVLFLKLHNIAHSLATTGGDAKPYETAKAAVQKVWADIVENDLAPRLFDATVWAERVGANSAPTSTPIAAEAVFAGLRFGHTMVRANYELNDVRDGPDKSTIKRLLEFFGIDGGGPFPPHVSWLIDWYRFFDMPTKNRDNPPINMARKIAPTLAQALQDAKSIRLPDDLQLPPTESGLAFRTLARGLLHQLPSGQGMIAAMARNGASVVWCLTRNQIRNALLTTYRPLDSMCPDGACLTDADVDRLEQATPLFLYILIEAADGRSACKLGPLGSYIAGDAFAKALAAARARQTLSAVLPSILSMPELVAFVAGNDHLS